MPVDLGQSGSPFLNWLGKTTPMFSTFHLSQTRRTVDQQPWQDPIDWAGL